MIKKIENAFLYVDMHPESLWHSWGNTSSSFAPRICQRPIGIQKPNFFVQNCQKE